MYMHQSKDFSLSTCIIYIYTNAKHVYANYLQTYGPLDLRTCIISGLRGIDPTVWGWFMPMGLVNGLGFITYPIKMSFLSHEYTGINEYYHGNRLAPSGSFNCEGLINMKPYIQNY